MRRSKETVTIIEAKPRTPLGRLRELVRFRTFYPFLFREITMRKWRATFLGFWWLILRPLLPTLMAVITFTFIIPVQSYGLPYIIFFLSGFTAWSAFQATVSFMPRTMLWMQKVMKKTYFPRMLVPLASFGPPLVELAVNLMFLLLAIFAYRITEGTLHMRTDAGLLLFPVAVLLALTFAFAVGMFLSVVALFMRDVIYSVGYVVQILMFLTPVIYPITAVPEAYRWIVNLLNPMAQVVETSRWAVTGQGVLSPAWLSLSAFVILGLTAFSVLFFVRTEDIIADAL